MACALLAVILLIVGIFKGFGSAQVLSQDPNNGVCCVECV
jgi:hypothetical protein